MSIQDLMQKLFAMGATPEMVMVAVAAVEEEHIKLAAIQFKQNEKRTADRDRKREARAKEEPALKPVRGQTSDFPREASGLSADIPRTVRGQSADKPPDKENPPDPLKKTHPPIGLQEQSSSSVAEAGAADVTPSADLFQLESPAPRKRGKPDDTPVLWQIFNEFDALAQGLGLPRPEAMTKKREGMLRARIGDLLELGHTDAVDGFRTRIFAKIRGSPFLRGETGWRPNLDFVLTESKFLKILEGGFDEKKDARPNGYAGSSRSNYGR